MIDRTATWIVALAVVCAGATLACGRQEAGPTSARSSMLATAAGSASTSLDMPVACGTPLGVGMTNQEMIASDRARTSPSWYERWFPTVQIVVDETHLWTPGNRLRVRFVDSTPDRIQRVRMIASEWLPPGLSVSFQFVDSGPADIRVSLPPQLGTASSEVGILARNIPEPRPTVIIGFDQATSDEQLRALVLHEFGHALGALHEHQRSDAAIQWDEPYVYAFYRKHYGWDEPTVDKFVFAPHEGRVRQSPAFDRDSVMMYAIPTGFTRDGFHQGWNSRLSRADIQLLQELYGKQAR